MHDFDEQRDATFQTFETLSAAFTIPETVELDINFFGDDGADMDGAEAALRAAGYEPDMDAEFLSIQVTLPLENPTAERIWEVERAVTEIALPFGFTPDGWGFPLDARPGLLSRIAAGLAGLFGGGYRKAA